MTDYKHPGGNNLLTNNTKKDIKKLFDDQGHSNFAKSLIEQFRIGYISSDGAYDNDSELFKIH